MPNSDITVPILPSSSLVLVTLLIFLIAMIGTLLVRRFALAKELLDMPVARSSHIAPTPRGGGLAIVLAFYIGFAILYFLQQLNSTETIVIIICLVIAVIGLLDDLHQLDYRWRIAIQFTAALFVLAILGPMPALQVTDITLNVGLVSIPVLVLTLVWSTNLYNFMDGIDGIAASECCFIAISAGLLLTQGGHNSLANLCWFLGAASAGFLILNWQPAKIFMGDVGSGFLGFLLAVIALLSIYAGSMSLWSWILLPGIFICDATLTVVRRMLRREPWYQAHRSHAYQHAALRYGHARVCIAAMLINVCWLWPLVWLTEIHPEYGVYLAVFGIVPLFLLAHWFGAGDGTNKD